MSGESEALTRQSYPELVALDGAQPGRIQVVRVPRGVSDDWLIRATYGFAERILATCAYERDAIALGRALARVLGYDCHFDVEHGHGE